MTISRRSFFQLAFAAMFARPARARTFINVKDAPYGAAWDGVTDDVVAVNAAIAAVSAAGGGVVYLPPGVGLLGAAGKSVALSLLSGVTLRGAGPGATTLRLKGGADSHLINASGVSQVGVEDLTLDGNRASQTASVHCFRVGGVDGLRLSNAEVMNAAHYGIGVQDGANKRVRISDVNVHDTGADGIDLKSKRSANGDVQLSRVSVRGWGLNPALRRQAAIDLRGAVMASNLSISVPGSADAVGVRCRNGEVGDANGEGAHGSQLSNFTIAMGKGATQIGLVCSSRRVAAINGRVSGGMRGVQVQASGFKASHVAVEDAADNGYVLDAAGGGLDADRAELSDCSAVGCGNKGVSIESHDVTLRGFQARNNGAGIVVEATANNTQVVGGTVAGNRKVNFQDLGTGTTVRGLSGYGRPLSK